MLRTRMVKIGVAQEDVQVVGNVMLMVMMVVVMV
jgi:hypothetical protein